MNEIINIFTDGKSASNTHVFLHGRRIFGAQYLKFIVDIAENFPTLEIKLIPILSKDNCPFETNKWSIRCDETNPTAVLMYNYKPVPFRLERLELIVMINDDITTIQSKVIWLDNEKQKKYGSLEDLEQDILLEN